MNMKKIVAATGMFPAVMATLLLAVSAVALTGCGDSAMIITDARPGSECPIGSAPVRAAGCIESCQGDYSPGLRCLPSGRRSICECIPNGEFPSGSQDAGVAPTPTPPGMVTVGTACPANGRVRQAVGGNCVAGQVLVATCVNLRWSSPSCTQADGGPGIWCVAGSVTDTSSCGVCPGGQSGRRQCDGDGMGYGDCLACPSTPNTCAGAGNACTAACAGGTVPGTIVCQGSVATCVATPGAQCSGGGNACTQDRTCTLPAGTCPAGTTGQGLEVCQNGRFSGTCVLTGAGCVPTTCTGAGTACTASCTGGTIAGTIVCQGTTATCVPNTNAQCTGGGGSGGNGTLRLRIDPGFWEYDRTAAGASTGVRFCSQSELNVRCFDWRGEQVRSPRTTDRVIALDSNWSGYVRCDVVCGDASGAPVHPALLDGRFTGSPMGATRGILTASVTGRGGSLENQVDVFRTCAGPGGPKFEVAINVDRLGRCAQ